MLVYLLWYRFQHDRWPTSRAFHGSAAWRMRWRAEGIRFLREQQFLARTTDEDDHVQYEVTNLGRAWVTPPDFTALPWDELPIEAAEYPEDEDELAIVSWVNSHYNRLGRWPTNDNYSGCATYRKSPDLFWAMCGVLAASDQLVRVQIRRGRNQVTRFVDPRRVPPLIGRDGQVFYYDPSLGPWTGF